MQYYSHPRIRTAPPSNPRRNRSSPRDGFFHLPTELAVNDPFLRRLYGVVAYVLDDHPYPTNRFERQQRAYEIQKAIPHLSLSSTQTRFLDRLRAETGIDLVDLWHGSHIITLDGGYLYHQWSRLPGAVARFSSHYPDVPLQQYGIAFKDHQLLFGKTNNHGSTWFQMEAHAFNPSEIFDDPDLAVYHGQDFLKYRVHRMNVGPFGLSPHTENIDPIIVPFRSLKQEHSSRRRVKSSRHHQIHM